MNVESPQRKKFKKMSTMIRTEIISRRCIKPTSPTPSHLKSFKISLLDQISPNIHGNMTLFYSPNAAADSGAGDLLSHFSAKSQLLQNALAETLTRFYPLAGRIRDTATVDCNDDGAVYIEARTDTRLSDFLSHPDFDILEHFLPSTDKETMELSNGSMLLVRFTLFGCGGTAVSISLTHKIADIAALITVLQSWTAACRARTEPDVPDLGLGASLFPPRTILGMSASVNIAAEKFTARRFVFTGFKVGELKSRVATSLGRDKSDDEDIDQFHPSRVEVVLALIWRCAMSASRSKTGSFKPSALFQAVNLRPRMEPPVPGTAIGNFVWPFAVTVEEEKELDLHALVKKMREGIKDFIEKKAIKFKEGGGFEAVMEFLKERGEMLKKKKETVVYKCSSWCRFPLYDVDYGWGNPVWMSSVNKMVSNTVALMDVKDGGVEALVTLNEQEMDIFEQHHELLQYAQLNPSIDI
ncbi:stemmadenine O-acetyltransferase-like [Prosopis cineraria]|uniref:stemmadenine O-acetyltransferase-like n=1 Tax=Prosopis cineraria TaxID=364024 RepID=UPI00240ECA21|nr:stemmadenine O-acetyltransferase-like [Prosopis cineraria]